MTDNHLNAQQIQQIQAITERRIVDYIERIELRKWAVEQAVTAYIEGNKLMYEATKDPTATPMLTYTDPMALAAAIFDFVVQPLKLDLAP
jgi:hypothetical protein